MRPYPVRRRPGARGFTLLELLIALSIFALISAMAYSGMNSVMTQRAQTELKAEQLKRLQLAFSIMERDFSQLIDRPVRGAYGSTLEALVGSSGIDGVELTRAGHANPAGFRRSDLQRVRYQSEDQQLLRQHWKVLDRAPDSEAVQQVLLDDVEGFALRYLDQSDQWQENWPPVGQPGQAPAGLPRVIEVELETGDFGKISWLFRLPEPFTASALPVPAGQSGNQTPGAAPGARPGGAGGAP